MESSRSRSRGRRLARSPTFTTLDRKNLWIERTKDEALNDFERIALVAQITTMTDDEVTAALATFSHDEKEDSVEDPPSQAGDPTAATRSSDPAARTSDPQAAHGAGPIAHGAGLTAHGAVPTTHGSEPPPVTVEDFPDPRDDDPTSRYAFSPLGPPPSGPLPWDARPRDRRPWDCLRRQGSDAPTSRFNRTRPVDKSSTTRNQALRSRRRFENLRHLPYARNAPRSRPSSLKPNRLRSSREKRCRLSRSTSS